MLGKASKKSGVNEMDIQASDKDGINLVIRNYVEGMVFADEALLRQAFHPSCYIIGHFQGTLEWLSLNDFVSAILVEGPATGDVKPFWQVESMDVTGDAAVVKIIDDYNGMRFTDYLSLLKIDDHWIITNKLYYYHE